MIQWLFFLWIVKWMAAIFGACAAAVAIMLFLIAVVAEIRDVLL
jgi:hypothetical protein